MQYFREYMISISAVLVFSVFITEIMVDVSWNKYVNFACGILFIITALSPVKPLFQKDFMFFSANDEDEKSTDYVLNEVIDTFSIKLEEVIKEDVKTSFSKDIDVDIILSDDSRLEIIVHTLITDDIYEYIENKYKPHAIHISDFQKE